MMCPTKEPHESVDQISDSEIQGSILTFLFSYNSKNNKLCGLCKAVED